MPQARTEEKMEQGDMRFKIGLQECPSSPEPEATQEVWALVLDVAGRKIHVHWAGSECLQLWGELADGPIWLNLGLKDR